MSQTRAFQQMEGLAKDTAALEDIYNRMVKMAENGAQQRQAEETKFSQKETEHYDYSKPFIQQVDDLMNGKIPQDDALTIGGTPDVLQKIGFSNLPMTINTEHIKNMNRDTEHALSRAFMEQLPELIKNPLAVIESKTNPENSTVLLLNAVVNGKPYVAPVYVTTTSRQNGIFIDSNNIATTFRKGNAITKMLTDAIQKENAGETGVYYWKKSEARSLFSGSGVQFPGVDIQDGLIHSIFDAGSPVNRKFMEQTETKQFKRWFGDSKVVDENGEPLVVYHATDADFTVFDREKLGQYTSENTDNEAAIESAKVGFWFSENDLREKTGNEKKMEVYLSIENPMETDLYTMLDVLENMTADEYRAELEEEGYDGLIVTDQEFDNAKSYVVFKPNQIKSATDNVGTFDYFNPDIRYSLKANAPRELIRLKESFQYILITMGAAIPHGSHCYYCFFGSFALEDLDQQAALAGAESVDPDGKIIVVAENEVQLGVADSGVLMHGQVFGAARTVRTAIQHRQPGKLAHGVVQGGAALTGAASVAQLTAAVDQHRRWMIAVGALVRPDLSVEIQRFAGLHHPGHQFAASHDVQTTPFVALLAGVVLKVAGKGRNGGIGAQRLVRRGNRHQIRQKGSVDVAVGTPVENFRKSVHKFQYGDFAALSDLNGIGGRFAVGSLMNRSHIGGGGHVLAQHGSVGRRGGWVDGRYILADPRADDIAYVAVVFRQHIGRINRVNGDGLSLVDGADHVAFAALLCPHANRIAVGGERLDHGPVQRGKPFDAGSNALRVQLRHMILFLAGHAFDLHVFGQLRQLGFIFFRQRQRQAQKQTQQQDWQRFPFGTIHGCILPV